MTIVKLNMIQKERTNLNITAEDLNELDEPLDNLLLDVMFKSFYKRISNKYQHLAPKK